MIDDEPEFIERRHTCDLKRREDMDYIAGQIAKEIQNSFPIPNEIHKAHHDYIASCITEKQEKAAYFRKIMENTTLVMLIGLLGIIGTAIWEYFKKTITK